MLCIHSCVVEHKPNVVWCSVDVYWTITANITWLLRKLGTVCYVYDGRMPTTSKPSVCVCSSTNKINQTSVFSTILEDDILYYARQLWSSYYTLNTYGVDRYRYDNLSTSLMPRNQMSINTLMQVNVEAPSECVCTVCVDTAVTPIRHAT